MCRSGEHMVIAAKKNGRTSISVLCERSSSSASSACTSTSTDATKHGALAIKGNKDFPQRLSAVVPLNVDLSTSPSQL